MEREVQNLLWAVGIAALIAGCQFQRASLAKRAQTELIGMPKSELLVCAGAPMRTAVAGEVEILTYGSVGDAVGVGTVHTTQEPGATHSYGTATVVSKRRYCEVTFILKDGVVTKINYAGRTGGLLSKGEQCAYVVENCLKEAPEGR